MFNRDIFCFIPACNETEEEASHSINTFRKESILDDSISKRLRLIIILDRQKDDILETPTFVAFKKLLGIQSHNEHHEPNFIKKHGCRVFKGVKDDIPYSLYVKGDNLITGKRYSILLLADILKQYEKEFHEIPKHILFLDCDTKTSGKDIKSLVDEIERDPHCGGVTGWIKVANSKSKNLIVAMQEFEIYLFNHVIDKAAASIFKKCTILPGAFSLIRYSCFKECLKEFSQVPRKDNIFTTNLLEFGEDRYLTTLLLSKGYNTRYTQCAVSYTVIPDTFSSFLTQQRRWAQSTFANTILLLFSKKLPLLKYSKWGFVQWLIIFSNLLSTLLLTGATAVIVAHGNFGDLDRYWVSLGTLVYLIITNSTIMNASVIKKERWIAINIILMALLGNYGVFWGIYHTVEPDKYLILGIFSMGLAVNFYTIFKFLNSRKWIKLICGSIVNQFSFILLIIVIGSIANLDNRSWGTRGIIHEKPSTELRKDIISAFLNKELIYVKNNAKWQAAQQPGKLSGFWKKIIILVLFSLVNLFYVFLFSPSLDSHNNLSFILSFSIIYMSNILSLPSFGLSIFYHSQMWSSKN